MKNHHVLKALILILNFIYTNTCLAAEDSAYELPKIVALENRKFNPKNDITVQFGILPLDAFYKGFFAGASYTYSYKSYLSWEMLNFQMVSVQDTSLKKDLITNFNVQPQGILDSIKYSVSSNVVYTPIYSKNLLFNTSLLYGEFSFLGGAGVVGFSSGEVAPMLGGGIMLRAFNESGN